MCNIKETVLSFHVNNKNNKSHFTNDIISCEMGGS